MAAATVGHPNRQHGSEVAKKETRPSSSYVARAFKSLPSRITYEIHSDQGRVP